MGAEIQRGQQGERTFEAGFQLPPPSPLPATIPILRAMRTDPGRLADLLIISLL